MNADDGIPAAAIPPNGRLPIPRVSRRAANSKHSMTKPRRKVVEACDKCREKRIKCDGNMPCGGCLKRGTECSLNTRRNSESGDLGEKMDDLLNRMHKLESLVERYISQPTMVDTGPRTIERQSMDSSVIPNNETGCLEYYGGTSNFVLASFLDLRLAQLENAGPRPTDFGTLQNQPCPDAALGLGRLLGDYDYVTPLNIASRRYRSFRKEVADTHLKTFFSTIYIYFPVMEESILQEKYLRLRDIFSSRTLLSIRPVYQGHHQELCLLYAILSLGALYCDNGEDSSGWASWYFLEAQELLGHLLDAVNLDLVHAAMFMGAYAQHAIKPNLAYNLVGVATRMAFSIGLNNDVQKHLQQLDAENGKKTWWMLFVQEVELSVDSGRPISVRSCDAQLSYPGVNVLNSESTSPVAFIPALADIAKITRDILKYYNQTSYESSNSELAQCIMVDKLDGRLIKWLESLPNHLRFQDKADCEKTASEFCSWASRQRSSLRVHYDLAIIILHRRFLLKAWRFADAQQISKFQDMCVKAASDIILHVNHLFKAAPSLKCWRYYCFYCLQATLVLLARIIDEPFTMQTSAVIKLCELSIEIFEQVELKAAERFGEVVRRILVRLFHKQNAETQASLRETMELQANSLHSHTSQSAITINSLLDVSHSNLIDTGTNLYMPALEIGIPTAVLGNPGDINAWTPDSENDIRGYIMDAENHGWHMDDWMKFFDNPLE